MDPVFLSRLQFAAATMFHLFKDPLTQEDLDLDEAY